MSDNDSTKDNDKNPFEDLQKQLEKILPGGGMMNMAPGGFGKMGAAAGGAGKGGDLEAEKERERRDNEALDRIRAFNLRPKDIRDHLNRYVIKQDEAKKVLSVAICDHYNHVRQCLETPAL